MDRAPRGALQGPPQESKLMRLMNHQQPPTTSSKPLTYSAIAAQNIRPPRPSNGPMPRGQPRANFNGQQAVRHQNNLRQPMIAPGQVPMQAPMARAAFLPRNAQQQMAASMQAMGSNMLHANLAGLNDLGVLPNMGNPPPNSMLQNTYNNEVARQSIGVLGHPNLVQMNMASAANMLPPNHGIPNHGMPGHGMPNDMARSANYGDIGVMPNHMNDIGIGINLGRVMHQPFVPNHQIRQQISLNASGGLNPIATIQGLNAMGPRMPNSGPLPPFHSRAMNNHMDDHSLDEAMENLCLNPMGPINKVYADEYMAGNFMPQSRDESPQPPVDDETLAQIINEGDGEAIARAAAAIGGNSLFSNNPNVQPHDLIPVEMLKSQHGAAVVSNMSPYAPVYTPSTYYQAEIQKGTTYFNLTESTHSDAIQRNEGFLDTEARVGEYADLPENLGMYTDPVPIEPLTEHNVMSSYRVTHRQTSKTMVMRRMHSTPMGDPKAYELWKAIDHPNIVKFVDQQESQAFGDTSTLLFYEFHPSSKTLKDKHLPAGVNIFGEGGPYKDPFSSEPEAPRPYTQQKNALLRSVASGALVPETFMWSLMVQMTSALRAIHKEGLACRNLHPNKVIMTGQRLRISWCGLPDFTHALQTPEELVTAQEEDIRALGHMAMSLAVRTVSWDNFNTCLEVISKTYSPSFRSLLLFMQTQHKPNVDQLTNLIGPERFEEEMKLLQRSNDILEEQYALELDNGRLLRILVKLGLINERPELNQDFTWSETGDRYLLKLFRDYLFHTVNASGHPCIDQGHITHCLNQLDSGTKNKIGLVSRDEEIILVVSFEELKHCLEQSIDELNNASAIQ